MAQKLMKRDDYLSMPAPPQAGPSRHGGFEMSHDAMGVTVSSNVCLSYFSAAQGIADQIGGQTIGQPDEGYITIQP
jgi:hypothetical protein